MQTFHNERFLTFFAWLGRQRLCAKNMPPMDFGKMCLAFGERLAEEMLTLSLIR